MAVVLALLAAPASVFVGRTWAGRDAMVGALAGVAGTAGLMLLYCAQAQGTMSIVAPLTAVLAAVVPMAVGLASLVSVE